MTGRGLDCRPLTGPCLFPIYPILEERRPDGKHDLTGQPEGRAARSPRPAFGETGANPGGRGGGRSQG